MHCEPAQARCRCCTEPVAEHHARHERLVQDEQQLVREQLEVHANGSQSPKRKPTALQETGKSNEAVLDHRHARLLAEHHARHERLKQNARGHGSTGGHTRCS